MWPEARAVKTGLTCKCPRCHEGHIYKPGFTMELKETCPVCGLNLHKNDSADGPAVFMIFILGFALVPLALWVDAWLSPPLWVHAVLWGTIAIGLTLGMLKPVKAYVIGLQYKHRPHDWEH
jgi:uncharacterized protein (DUF983 family)